MAYSPMFGPGMGPAASFTSFPATTMWIGPGHPFHHQPPQPREQQLELVFPFPSAPIEAGELVGYRCWNVQGTPFGFTLMSISQYGFYWKPQQIMRAQDCDRVAVLEPNGHVGFWSFKTEKHLYQNFRHGYDVIPDYAYGSIWLWGNIIEHEDGYRSEYAAVRSLDHFVHTGPQRFRLWPAKDPLIALRSAYGVGSDADAKQKHNAS